MKGRTIRALVLAAGEGRRLRPLTQNLPKPLLPAAGQSVLAHTLNQLERLGCEAVALNLHHCGDRIENRIGERWGGLEVVYSREPQLLGTLGALAPLRAFFSGCDLALLLNGDSLCRWPLKQLVRQQIKHSPLATLLCLSAVDAEAYGGGIGLDAGDSVVQFRRSGPKTAEAKVRRVFGGAHVLSRELLDRLPHEAHPSDIVGDLYQPLLAEGGAFRAVTTGRAWHDLGTPERYLRGVLDWSRGRPPLRWLRRNWVSSSARVGRGVRLRNACIEAGATVEAGARLRRVVALPGSTVGAGARLTDAIIGPNVSIPPGSAVERRMVTNLADGRRDQGGDSVLGQLVFSPIET